MKNNRIVGSMDGKAIVWTAKQTASMVKNGSINFDHIIQRSFVWERERKTKLIESMLIGYKIPSIIAQSRPAEEGEVTGRSSRVYMILDGKQRLSTIKEFINNEFAMTKINPVYYYEDDGGNLIEFNVTGKTFDELPVELKDKITSASINIDYFDDLDDEQQRELFIRLNNGKPLSTKSKTLANCKCITDVMKIGKHPLFEEMLTEKAKANKNQVSIIFKIWEMINLPIAYVDFSSKAFNEIVANTEIRECEKDGIESALDFMFKVHSEIKDTKVAKKFYNESNFVSLVPFVCEYLECNSSSTPFVEFVNKFFGTGDKRTSISELYNECSSNGTAKSHNIVGRHTALKKEFDAMFATSDDEEFDEELELEDELETA